MTDRSWIARWFALTTVIVAASCSSEGGSSGSAVCERSREGVTSDGDAVQICEELHGERPYLRPPPDDVEPDLPSTLYLAALNVDYSEFIDRDGTTYSALIDGSATLPASLHAPSNRMLYLIYRVTGTVSMPSGDADSSAAASIDIDMIEPAIMIEGRAIDGRFLGPWEGTVSLRAEDSTCTITVPCWDATSTVPLRVVFETLTQLDNIGELGLGAPLLADGERFELRGAVENLSQAVTASDGRCLPPLSALGSTDPFAPSTTGDLTLWRYPGMHTEQDLALVMDYPRDTEGMGGANGMSRLNVLHPANLIQTSERSEWNGISILNHGTPNGSEIILQPVRGGGEDCTP